jgi:DNA recombination protein RmuC
MQAATLVVVILVFGTALLLLSKRGNDDFDEVKFLKGVKEELQSGANETRLAIKETQQSITDQLERANRSTSENYREERKELGERLERFSTTLQETSLDARKEAKEAREALENSLEASLEKMTERLKELRESNEKQLASIAEKVDSELNRVRESNEKKLDEMRETVDEKLHGTLEKRLGESFKQVSERLEAVHQGLGEMQKLASGVGDLKRVLTNVKSRGGWGEVQLGRQLEDILTVDQYEQNVAVNPGSRERVEFAIKLPGRVDDEIIYLPIDAKFPQEDYDRLVTAQEAGDLELVETTALQLEKAVKLQAKTISEKYVCPPHTTDFAVMYLPTEGLFAEVIRRPGLCAALQRDSRVLVTGPTTLMAILNSLQMGFRTMAIEKSASEVWRTLGAARTEFGKYAQAWEKVDKQLGTIHTSVTELGRRSRAIERSLKSVESGDPATSARTLGISNDLLNLDSDSGDLSGIGVSRSESDLNELFDDENSGTVLDQPEADYLSNLLNRDVDNGGSAQS